MILWAPARLSVVAASKKVAPEVETSSKRRQFCDRTFSGDITENAFTIFVRRSFQVGSSL